MTRPRLLRVLAPLAGFALLAAYAVWRVNAVRPVAPTLPVAVDEREARLRELLFDDPAVAARVPSEDLEALALELLVIERGQRLQLASTKSMPLRLERPVDVLRAAIRERLARGARAVAAEPEAPDEVPEELASVLGGLAANPLSMPRDALLDRAIDLATPSDPVPASDTSALPTDDGKPADVP